MNQYAILRARQKARSHIIEGVGAMRKLNLHRTTLVDLEADDSCAPEGHWRVNQGDPIPKVPRSLKVPRGETSWIGPIIGALVVGAVGLVSFFFLVTK